MSRIKVPKKKNKQSYLDTDPKTSAYQAMSKFPLDVEISADYYNINSIKGSSN